MRREWVKPERRKLLAGYAEQGEQTPMPDGIINNS